MRATDPSGYQAQGLTSQSQYQEILQRNGGRDVLAEAKVGAVKIAWMKNGDIVVVHEKGAELEGTKQGNLQIAKDINKAGETLREKDKRIAFVGGAADSTSEIVKGIHKNHGGPNDMYFEWTQGDELALWIDENHDSALTVIGHSYGGDTAAGVVADGHFVSTLITVDPVGMFRPNFSDVANYSSNWINYNSVGTGIKWSNFVATMGRAYNGAPNKFADSHHDVKLDHVDICVKHCVP